MPGANCYSHDYTFLEHQLAGKGYLVAVVDQLHPVTPETSAYISRTHSASMPTRYCAFGTALLVKLLTVLGMSLMSTHCFAIVHLHAMVCASC